MTEAGDGAEDNTENEGAADAAVDASSDGWQDLANRADDEQRHDRGEDDTTTGGTSPAPDVDLLAGALGGLADTVAGGDADEDTERR